MASYFWLGLFYVLVGYLSLASGQRGRGRDPRCRRPIDLCFVLDRSGSIEQSGWRLALEFTNGIIDTLQVSRDVANIGVVSFADGVTGDVPLGQYPDVNQLQSVIRQIRYTNGKTNTAAALNRTVQLCFGQGRDRPDAINVVIIVTDGMPTVDAHRLPQAIVALHSVAQVVISVGVGDEIEESTLILMAKRADNMRPPIPLQDYFTTPDYRSLSTLLPTLTPLICPPIDPPTPPPQCKQPLDLCFVLDQSFSVMPDGWQMTLDFVKNILMYIDVSPDVARVGIVVFSTNARVAVPLGLHTTNEGLVDAINALQYTAGYSTNTAAGLTSTHRDIFRAPADRPGVINVVIFISDGIPTTNQFNLRSAIRDLHVRVQRVVSIGVGNSVLTPTLVDIALRTDRGAPRENDDYFIRPNFGALLGLVNDLAPTVCPVGPTLPPTVIPPERICNQAVDLCLMLDMSGSVGQAGWDMIQMFVRSLIAELTISDSFVRVGVVTFADQAILAVPLGQYPDSLALIQAVNSIRFTGGDTNTVEAMLLTANGCFQSSQDRSNVDNIALLLSDGMPSVNTQNLGLAIATLHSQTVVVATISVGNNIDRQTLRRIAKRGTRNGQSIPAEDDIFTTDSFNRLPDLVQLISSRVCPRPPACSSPIDLCIVLDSSSSVQREGWESTKMFIARILETLTIGPNDVQVGVITFSTEARVDITLGAHNNNGDLVGAVRGLEYKDGQTNTADALILAATQCFGTLPDRPEAGNVAMVVTDGIPTVRRTDLASAIRELHDVASVVASIGVGNGVDTNILRQIAKRSGNGVPVPPVEGEDFFRTQRFDTLQELLGRVAPRVCPTPEPPMCTAALDLCFIFDSSGSVTPQGWVKTKDFATRIVESLVVAPDQVRVGVIRFSNNADLVIPLGRHFSNQDLTAAINNLDYIDGETNTADALSLAANGCFNSPNDRRNVQNAALVLTDGMPTLNLDRLPQSIQSLHRETILVASIGVGPEINETTLRTMTKAFGNQRPRLNVDYFITPDFDTLGGLVSRIAPRVCPTPPPVTPPPCGRTLDVCLILDSSGSVQQDGWRLVQQFASKFATCFAISTFDTRFGVITFSNAANVRIGLGQHSSVDSLTAAINTLPHENGWTNTAAALNAAADLCFRSGNDRPGVDNVGVVITDGTPTIDHAGLPQAVINIHNATKAVIVVGVGTEISEDILIQMTKTSDGRSPVLGTDLFILPTFDQLTDYVGRIVDLTCALPVTPPTPPINICRQAADICLMLDASGSEKSFWDDIRRVAIALIRENQQFPEAPQYGVISFSDHAIRPVPLDFYEVRDLENRINAIQFVDGYTNIGATLRLTSTDCFRTRKDRNNAKNVAIFISDGVTTVQHDTVPPSTSDLHEAADFVYAIGIGDYNVDSLRNISEREDGGEPQNGLDFSINPDDREIRRISQHIRRSLCDGPPVPPTFLPPTPRPTPRPPPGPCRQAVDLCFVLDSSGSISMIDWARTLSFTQTVVDFLDMSPATTRLGVVTFSTNAQLVIPLDGTLTSMQFMDRVAPLQHQLGRTNTAEALEVTANQCFAPNRDRPGVGNAVIFVTDGMPNIRVNDVNNAALLLKSRAPTIVAVGVGQNVTQSMLEIISQNVNVRSPPQRFRDFFLPNDFIDLGRLTEQIARRACPQP